MPTRVDASQSASDHKHCFHIFFLITFQHTLSEPVDSDVPYRAQTDQIRLSFIGRR